MSTSRYRIQTLQGEHPRRRWSACGSMTFTLASGRRVIERGPYEALAARLVEVGTGRVAFIKGR